jgi:uncharacterized membrane protein YtjA (UPF0391 family)
MRETRRVPSVVSLQLAAGAKTSLEHSCPLVVYEKRKAQTKTRCAYFDNDGAPPCLWALTFLVVALIAAVLGFGGIAGFAVEIAKIIFFVAISLFVISAVFAVIRGRSPTVP